MTYALYAVIVHEGTAEYGKYFAYISDGHNWYKFDNTLVTKVSNKEVRKYGTKNSKENTVACMLFYRETTTFKDLKEI